MKNIPLELETKVKKYSLMVAWWQIHEGDKTMVDKLEEVLGKIEQTEDELRLSGIKDEVFDEILKRAKKFITLTVGEMTDKQLETMTKLIFGKNTKMVPFDKRELSKPGVIYFDPVKYAEYAKKNQKKEIEYIPYVHKKPLWKGQYISVRNYVVENALAKGAGLKLTHEDRTMTLSPAQVKSEGIHNNANSHVASITEPGIKAGDTYYLVDYNFKPDE